MLGAELVELLERAGFDPGQPRDPLGKWVDVPGVGALIEALRGIAARLNDGKKLDLNDPTELRLAQAIAGWTTSRQGPDGSPASLKDAVSYAIRHDPMGGSHGAVFARAVAAAPPTAPRLYRGMHHVFNLDIPREGDTFDLAPTSLTSDRGVAEDFALPGLSGKGHASGFDDLDHGGDTSIVLVEISPRSRALRIDQHAGEFGHEREYVGMGRYRVISKRFRTKSVKVGGKRRDLRVVELIVEQVIDTDGDPTFVRDRHLSPDVDYDIYG